MITTFTKVITRPGWRATSARRVTAHLKRQKSAYTAAGQSMKTHEPEAEARGKFLERLEMDNAFREEIAYSLSFVGDSLDSDFESDNTFHLLDDRMKRQLRKSYNALLSPSDYCAQKLRSRLPPQLDLAHLDAWAIGKRVKRKLPPLEEDGKEPSTAHYAQPLPESISDIMPSKLDQDARAIVVTDTKNPYCILTVNTAWENLCGYSREECKGHSLGLLQGPETDMNPVTAMIGKLLQGEQAEATFTNYTKHGRKFQNSIQVGPIFDEMGKTVNFVGVLREVENYEASIENSVGDGRAMQLPFMS